MVVKIYWKIKYLKINPHKRNIKINKSIKKEKKIPTNFSSSGEMTVSLETIGYLEPEYLEALSNLEEN